MEKTTEAATISPQDWIAGIDKGLKVLEAFSVQHPRLSATEAGQLTGLTRTAARRHLLTLAHLGYVATDGRQFWLTPRVLRLAHVYLETSPLARIVQPFLQRVTAGTQEVAYVSVMDGDDIIFIARNGQNRQMNTGFAIGARMPAQVTASGILMLALRGETAVRAWLDRTPLKAFTSHTITSRERLDIEMRRIREQGYAFSEQQIDLHYRGVAVPLIDRRGDLVGALNVTMPMGHESRDEATARVLPVLRETAAAMRALL